MSLPGRVPSHLTSAPAFLADYVGIEVMAGENRRFCFVNGRFLCIFAVMDKRMDDKDHSLEEPGAEYGRKVKASEIVFEPMPHMRDSLRAQGYITHEEFVDRLSKYL